MASTAQPLSSKKFCEAAIQMRSTGVTWGNALKRLRREYGYSGNSAGGLAAMVKSYVSHLEVPATHGAEPVPENLERRAVEAALKAMRLRRDKLSEIITQLENTLPLL